MQVGAKTSLGQVRKVNEDNYLLLEEDKWKLYAVADGMGGHKAGEVASYLAVETLKEFFSNSVLTDLEKNWRTYLNQAFLEANSAIVNLSQKNTEHEGMGTTLTAVLYIGERLYIGHVGDSRAYLIRNEKIRRITNDHSLVEELVRRGEITDEEAKNHPQRNILLRALGSASEITVDFYDEDFYPNDIAVLATDGLTNLVEDREIKETTLNLPPLKAVEQLIKLANSRGGYDNITVLVVKNELKKKINLTTAELF